MSKSTTRRFDVDEKAALHAWSSEHGARQSCKPMPATVGSKIGKMRIAQASDGQHKREAEGASGGLAQHRMSERRAVIGEADKTFVWGAARIIETPG